MERVHDLGTTSGAAPAQLADVAAHYRWPVTAEPWVRSNFVSTIDGSVQGQDGRSGTINTEADHLVFDLLRALCDVVVVGAGTVRRERYRAVELTEDQQRVRSAHGLAGVPTLVVVSTSLDLPRDLARGDGEVLVVTGGADIVDPPEGTTVHRAQTSPVSPAEIIDLCRNRGWPRVLVEGGPQLHHEFLDLGLVDEICVSTAPLVTSGHRLGLASGAELRPPIDFTAAGVVLVDDTVMVRWRRNRR